MKRIQPKFLLAILVLISSFTVGRAQQAVENAVFWEVKGKDLKSPSFLFGTFHLLTAEYLDSLPKVNESFRASRALAGEIVFDSSSTMKIMMAAMMKDTTLQQVLSDREYAATASWLKELSGIDLKVFNTFNPITVQMTLMSFMQKKVYPTNAVVMDMHFQNQAKMMKKKLVGLESLDEQISVLFKSASFKRQGERLAEFVQERDKAHTDLVRMNVLYRQQNLGELEKLMYEGSYTENERNSLLDNRNKQWMKQLPGLFREQSTFVAVGALHLAGENGIVNLLRNQGYTVTPLSLR